jgi:sugar phosphate isomerase/epimerase
MKISQVALQLYTVRERMKTATDVADTLKAVAKIGYPAVELASLPAMSVEDLAGMLSDAGLICCSTHNTMTAHMLDDPAAAAEVAKKLGSSAIACPGPSGAPLGTMEDWLAFARRLNAAGKVYHEAGLSFSYHNHHTEFQSIDGRLMLEVFYGETDPRYVQAEIDTYWVQYGGGDPVDWCHRLAGRLPLLHMKDYRITPERKPTFAEVGRGNLAWKKIVAAAGEAGCTRYIVEQDQCDGDPLDSARLSFEYIRDNLCS